MKPFKKLVVAIAATLAVAAQAAAPSPYVIDPAQPVAGQSQLDLSQQWWQWILGAPAATNPLFDADGSFAGVNNNGSVFFLAGSWLGTPSVSRTINVAEGRPIFFPVLNNASVYYNPSLGEPEEVCDSAPDRVACGLSFIDMSGAAGGLTAMLDGKDLLTYPDYRQTSNGIFKVNLPADNVFAAFGLPVNEGEHDAVSDGYWVALSPLPTGVHTLTFGGANGDFTLDVTDRLQVPEPAAPLSFLAAGLALWSGLRRRGRGRHDGASAPQPA